MGFPPYEVDRMSLWQFRACLAGWAEANGGTTGMTADEFAAAAAALDAAPDTTL
jgi:hypothetical protein